jgi:hypothetical protein
MDNENVQPVPAVTGLNRGTFGGPEPLPARTGGYTSPVFGIRIAGGADVRE